MSSTNKTIGVLGAGSWGAALAMVLNENGHRVFLWSNDASEIERIAATRRLLHKLPDVRLPDAIQAVADPNVFADECELLVVAVPSKVMKPFAEGFAPLLRGRAKIAVSASKGIQAQTLQTLSEQLEDYWRPHIQSGLLRGVAALSGPSHAEEVAKGLPTAIVAAHTDETIAREIQDAFQNPRFRVYRNHDRRGVEIGAALKNVLAIAVGISDGLGFGDNARAALISRGLFELSQIGRCLDAQPETFIGLSGLGDLVVTCTSQHSRNRKFGEMIAKGYSPQEAEEEIGMVVEGVTSVQAVPNLVQTHQMELPISQEVYSVVIEGRDPKLAVENLMQRESKPEA